MIQEKKITLGQGISLVGEFNNGAFETLVLSSTKKVSLKMSVEDVKGLVEWLNKEVLGVAKLVVVSTIEEVVATTEKTVDGLKMDGFYKDPKTGKMELIPKTAWDLPKSSKGAGLQEFDISDQLDNIQTIKIPKK